MPSMAYIKQNKASKIVNDDTFTMVLPIVFKKKLKLSQDLANLKTLSSLKILNTYMMCKTPCKLTSLPLLSSIFV